MKKTFSLLLLFAFFTSIGLAAVDIQESGRFIRIEERIQGKKELVALNKGDIMSLKVVSLEGRKAALQITTRELVPSGQNAVNQTYSFAFISELEARKAFGQLILLAGNFE